MKFKTFFFIIIVFVVSNGVLIYFFLEKKLNSQINAEYYYDTFIRDKELWVQVNNVQFPIAEVEWPLKNVSCGLYTRKINNFIFKEASSSTTDIISLQTKKGRITLKWTSNTPELIEINSNVYRLDDLVLKRDTNDNIIFPF